MPLVMALVLAIAGIMLPALDMHSKRDMPDEMT